MDIQLTAKHLKITPAIRAYVEQKFDKAQRYFDHIIWGSVFLSIEKRSHRAEFVVHAARHTFRAQAVAADIYAAVDLVSDKIDHQLKKYKERLKDRHKGLGRGEKGSAGIDAATILAQAPLRIERVKQLVRPITPEEAARELESLGQTFRLFQDKDSEQIHVIYRRNDDTYGVLQPVKRGGR